MSQQALAGILMEIAIVFREGDDAVRSRQFEELRSWAEGAESAEDLSGPAGAILRLYGGMGSFNDAMIRKNGIVDEAATDKPDRLRGELFERAASTTSSRASVSGAPPPILGLWWG